MANSEFKPLSRSFYDSNTVLVAKKLLGKLVVRKLNGQVISGRIVETEAYTSGEHDPASHACRGMTERNKVMFGKNGISYVYFTYGMYFMFNVVAKKKTEDAGAVLIRALEPIKGIKIMELNNSCICAVYEPSGDLRKIATQLNEGDYLKIYGGIRKPTVKHQLVLNVEQIEILKISDSYRYMNDICK